MSRRFADIAFGDVLLFRWINVPVRGSDVSVEYDQLIRLVAAGDTTVIGKVLKPLALAGAACAACCVLPSRAAAQMQPTRSTVVDPAAVSDSEVATTPAPSNEGAPRVAVAAGVPAPAMTSADQPVARRPYAAPVVEVKPGVVWTYGSRDYAGRTWLIVPGGWYPPVWEDPCGRRRTNVIKGHAKWPGLRVDSNSDEVVVYPYPPRAVEVRYR